MTIILYKRLHLEDRAHRNLRVWKGCHITVYLLAAIFGILNCSFLFLTLRAFDSRCVLDPHELVFREPFPEVPTVAETTTPTPQESAPAPPPPPREPPALMLDVAESRFRLWEYCDLPLSAPLVCGVAAGVWAAMFCVCAAGGRSKRGATEPWTIVTPALVLTLAFLLITGHNFFGTDRGLRELCLQFYNVTNTTSCTRAMDAHVPAPTPPTSLSPSAGIAATRAACAGALACWAVAAALLLARCLSGADFALHSTRVHLHPPKRQKTPLQRRPCNQKRVRIADSDIHDGKETDGAKQEAVRGTTQQEGKGSARENDTPTSASQETSVDQPLNLNAADFYSNGLLNGKTRKEMIELSKFP